MDHKFTLLIILLKNVQTVVVFILNDQKQVGVYGRKQVVF